MADRLQPRRHQPWKAVSGQSGRDRRPTKARTILRLRPGKDAALNVHFFRVRFAAVTVMTNRLGVFSPDALAQLACLRVESFQQRVLDAGLLAPDSENQPSGSELNRAGWWIEDEDRHRIRLLNGYLAPYVWQFLDRHPGIEFSCTDTHLSLSRRDADVAIRFTGRPPETLIGRRLAKMAFGVYSGIGETSNSWDRSNVEAWDWIGWHDEFYNRMLITRAFPEARIKYRVDSIAALQSMARHGLGIGVLPCYTADPDPGLRRVLPKPLSEGTPDLWILHHSDLRGVSRVSLFAEFIADIIAADRDLFEGRRPQNPG
jgi:hypothetical protein